MPLSFITIISSDNITLTLDSSHPFLALPFIKQLNLNEPLPLCYHDLYLAIFNIGYNLLTQDELGTHLDVVDSLSILQSKINTLDRLIQEYKDTFDPNPYLTPDILTVKSDYFVNFPHLMDNYFEIFCQASIENQLLKDLRKEKFLEFCRDKKVDEVKLLFHEDFLQDGYKTASKVSCKELKHFFIEKGADPWGRDKKEVICKKRFDPHEEREVICRKRFDPHDEREVLCRRGFNIRDT
jgi:hypothetical protein